MLEDRTQEVKTPAIFQHLWPQVLFSGTTSSCHTEAGLFPP